MPPKKKQRASLEFEPREDYMPGFLKALDELVVFYETQDDFRAKSFKKAREALEGQIVTSVDDIKLLKLSELAGVGKATLECLTEFIETNKIQRLEELRPKVVKDTTAWRNMDGKPLNEPGDNLFPGFKKLYRNIWRALRNDPEYDGLKCRGLSMLDYSKLLRLNISIDRQIDIDDCIEEKVDGFQDLSSECIEMLREYVKTGTVKKFEKELFHLFVEEHEPIREYFLKKSFSMTFSPDSDDYLYDGDQIGFEAITEHTEFEIVIACGYSEDTLKMLIERSGLEKFQDEKYHNSEGRDMIKAKVKEFNKTGVGLEVDYDFTKRTFEGYVEVDPKKVPGKCYGKGRQPFRTHPFTFSYYLDDSDTHFKALGWTPPGLEQFLYEELSGDKWEEHVIESSDDEEESESAMSD